jgi:hypothetical protein
LWRTTRSASDSSSLGAPFFFSKFTLFKSNVFLRSAEELGGFGSNAAYLVSDFDFYV